MKSTQPNHEIYWIGLFGSFHSKNKKNVDV